MAEITDYDVIVNEDVSVLIFNVKSSIRDGWQPLGGVSTSQAPAQYGNDPVLFFCQAMVKTKTPQ